MHHAVLALGITALVTVTVPVGLRHEFLEGVRVSVLKQVAGLLPSENVVGRNAPGGALVIALTHQELEEERTLVEAPLLTAIAQNLTIEFAGILLCKKVRLIRSLLVAVAGRDHHALDAEVHHFVHEAAYALGIGTVEQC